jgi:hypothetical protein
MESRLEVLEQTIQTLINRLNDQDTLIQTLISAQKIEVVEPVDPEIVVVVPVEPVVEVVEVQPEVVIEQVEKPVRPTVKVVKSCVGHEDLTSKTVTQLKSICRDYNIKAVSKCNKNSLIKLINDYKNVVESVKNITVKNVTVENLMHIYLYNDKFTTQDYEDVLNNACRDGKIHIVRELSNLDDMMIDLNVKNAAEIAKDYGHRDIVKYLNKEYLHHRQIKYSLKYQ